MLRQIPSSLQPQERRFLNTFFIIFLLLTYKRYSTIADNEFLLSKLTESTLEKALVSMHIVFFICIWDLHLPKEMFRCWCHHTLLASWIRMEYMELRLWHVMAFRVIIIIMAGNKRDWNCWRSEGQTFLSRNWCERTFTEAWYDWKSNINRKLIHLIFGQWNL